MITTLTGSNSFLLRKELKRLVAEFVAEHTDMGLERLDGEEVVYDRIREALESLPFLAAKKLVVLQKPSANKEFLEKVADLLQDVPETTDVIIVEPKPDKRTSYYKFLKKNTELKEFHELDEGGLARWAADQAKARGGSLSSNDARFLVQRTGVNQQLLDNELEKLLAYDSSISKKTIELLIDPSPQSNIFDLLDAALAGNTKRALELYQEQRDKREEPQKILAMLAWQLHVLALVKVAGDKSPDTVAREAKINPYTVSKTAGLARQISLRQAEKIVHDALELDVRMKSESIDADEALQHLLISIKN